MAKPNPTAEDRMNSALRGCLFLFAVVAIVMGLGGWLIIQRVLS